MILPKSELVLTTFIPRPLSLLHFECCGSHFTGSFLKTGLSLPVLLSHNEVDPLLLTSIPSVCQACTSATLVRVGILLQVQVEPCLVSLLPLCTFSLGHLSHSQVSTVNWQPFH